MNTSKSQIFAAAHAQAKRTKNMTSKTYAVCFAEALKSEYATVRMEKKQAIEMAAVYASRKEKNVSAAIALKATAGFNGKIYGSENNYSYYISGRKISATNEFVAAFNELETKPVVSVPANNSDSSTKRTTYKYGSAFLNLDGEDWGYGDGDDN
jgi:hypothetical protein